MDKPTEVVVKSLDLKPEVVRISLFETKKENMAVGGQLFIDKEDSAAACGARRMRVPPSLCGR